MKVFKIIIISLLVITICLSSMILLKVYIFSNESNKLESNKITTAHIDNELVLYKQLIYKIASIYNLFRSNLEINLSNLFFKSYYKQLNYNNYLNYNTVSYLPKINYGKSDLWVGSFERREIINTDKNFKGKVIKENSNVSYKMKASTWLNISDKSINLFVENAKYFNHVHPFLYDIKGKIVNKAKVLVKRKSEAIFNMIKSIRKANPDILIIPTIFRWETNTKLEINEVIGKGSNGKSIMNKHIKSLIDLTDKYGFDGIDIDYEGMDKNKKNYFTNFICELRKAIDKYNYENNKNIVLSLSLHPKTWASEIVRDACIIDMGFKGKYDNYDNIEVKEAKKRFASYSNKVSFKTARKMTVGKWKTLNDTERENFCINYEYSEQWRGPQTHNFYDLNKYADYIKIMAYEKFPMYGIPGPGPQAPIDWIKRITRYTYDHIPNEKIYIGLPTYGYQRPVGGDCKGTTTFVFWDNFKKLAKKYSDYEYPTKVYRPDDKNWKHYDILHKYNPKYAHTSNNTATKYYEPAVWYKNDECYIVAFSVNGEAYNKKIDAVNKYPVSGFSMWQFTTRNDENIVEEIKKQVDLYIINSLGTYREVKAE